MRLIYGLLVICSLAFSADLTPEQMRLVKSAGFTDADIQKVLSNNLEKEFKSTNQEQIIENDIEKGELDKDKVEEDELKKNELNIEEVQKDNLKKYGSLFFNNKNKLDPYSVPTPNNYNINYGDKLTLDIYGAENESFELEVDKNGNINIPQVSELKVIGLEYKDVQKLVIDEVNKAYPNNTNVLLNISEFTSIQITITGLVNAPGLYNLSSFSTIKDALITSGGILENGSYRNIYLKRAGKNYKIFDLYSLIKYGDTNIDTVLKSGDVILVKPINKEIKLTGEVNYNALFELKNNESFKDLFNFAAGLKPKANENAIRLKRYENNSIAVYTLTKDELYKYTPKNGDEVHIYPTSELSAKLVKIEGNVIAPSEKSIPNDNKLSTLLKNELKQFGENGYFLNDTNYEFAIVKNDNNLQGFNIKNVLNKKEDINLKIGDIITIFKNSEFKEKPYVYANGEVVNNEKRKYDFSEGMNISDLFAMVDFNSEIIEENEDSSDNENSFIRTSLSVDKTKVQITRFENNKKTTFLVNTNKNKNFKLKKYDEVRFFDFSKVNNEMKVSIRGEVFIPGTYNIGDGTTINDIVNIAGGLTKKALMSRFEVSRYYTENNERKRKVLALDMNKALDLKIKIYEDDEITIFPIVNWNEKMYVELKGLVKYPGRYAIEQGEKLSSVILRAGGFLSNAFIEGAVFTREEIRILQEKRLEESLDRLNAQIVKTSVDAQGFGENAEDSAQKIQAVKQLENQAKLNKPIGRVSLNLYYDLNRFKNSTYDLVLKDKDALYVPSINDTVSVVGEVLNQNTFVYDSKLNTDDYLSKAGGITELANEEYIYIVKANGETQKYESSYFFGNDKKIFKGDTIVVPMEFDTISDIKFAKDITQILYQLAITAASLKTVGAF